MSFLSSLTDKLSGVIPHDPRVEAFHHSLRNISQQYSSTTPVQRIITVEKSVALDFDALGRDAKAQSKELYTWGQSEDADLKDVTDRLAYLNFVQGSLASSLAVKLDAARTTLKNLRDAEAALVPRRNLRAGYQTQISRLEHDKPHGLEKRLADLRELLRKAEAEDEPLENQVKLLKRQAVRESEKHKWEAVREYGEKLVLLSQAAEPIIAVLPTFPPTEDNPYDGGHATGAVRASLQRALDNYKTGHIHLPNLTVGADLSRSETRSFGESHARELSNIAVESSASVEPSIPLTPPGDAVSPGAAAAIPKATSPPLDPSTLNLSPAPIPAPVTSSSSSVPIAETAPISVPELPTVAETGLPVSAGADGPGPASGSLRDIRAASSTAGPRSGGLPGNESANPAYGSAGSSSQQKFESASEEKRRLREYSEAAQQPPSGPDDQDSPPSYQE